MKRPLAHRAIYKPEGPAAEYAVWGCNLYKGCPHQCTPRPTCCVRVFSMVL